MEENRTPKHSGTYWMAGIFIAVGLLLLGKNLHIISPYVFRIFVSWQMLLIVIGFNLLSKRQYLGSLALIGTGVYFLLPRINFINDTFSAIFWPALLIIAGILVITTRKKHKFPNHRRIQCDNTNYNTQDGFIQIDNNMGSVQQIVSDEVFKGGSIRNSFGSVVLDLRRTSLAPGTTVINMSTNFGGVEIYAPANWIIKSELQSTLGGVEDSRIASISGVENDKILLLRGSVSFSGVEIKS